MENPEEILHSLEEFSKMKPKDIPRELEEYLCFVAKTGDPVYQWSTIKSLFREKLIKVITDFYESCPSVEIPPCPNVELFNYDSMKNFILEKLDTFAAAPFTVQRISELLTTPRKEYNRIDKYMRALEKNILVVSTVEPGDNWRSTENGESIMNGIQNEVPETSHEINVEEMDDSPAWPRVAQTATVPYQNENEADKRDTIEKIFGPPVESKPSDFVGSSSSTTQNTVITCRNSEEPYVSIEPVPSNTCTHQENAEPAEVESVTITAIPAGVQKRRSSVEPVVTADSTETEQTPTEAPVEEGSEAKKPTEVSGEPADKPAEPTETTNEEPQLKEVEPALEVSQIPVDACPILSSDSSGIENISPETSTSSPENLQVDTQIVEVETSDKPTDVSQSSEVDVVEEPKPAEQATMEEVTDTTTKCSEVQMEPSPTVVQPSDESEITSTLEEPKLEDTVAEAPCTSEVDVVEKTEEAVIVDVVEKNEVDSSEAATTEIVTESPVVEVVEDKPVEVLPESTETPMDVDEVLAEKPEEVVANTEVATPDSS